MPSNTIYPRGTLLQERYRIIEAVGTGGYGVVYRAEDTLYNDELVAVKSINLAGLSTQEVIEATEAFNREVLMLSRLQHFSLPGIHTHFTDPEHWYMVMDFIEGETLEDYIAHTDAPLNGTRCLPLLEVLAIGLQLCTVLGYLHSQVPSIIFRDLKPANIMRLPDGHLYLIDFGIARHFKQGQAKDTIPLGSPGYAAPEQYGRTQTTPRADIYSLGALLHQLISGDDPSETPFHFTHLLTVDNPILATLDELLLQMVEKDERNRPASITIVKRRLQQIQFSALPPRVVTPPRKTRKIQVSRRVFVGTLATALVVGTLVRTLPLAITEQDVTSGSSPEIISASGGTSDMQGTSLDTALYTYQNHKRSVSAVAWSPNGDVVASGDVSGNVYVWKPFTGEILLTWPLPSASAPRSSSAAGIQALSWSPTGQQLAIADTNGTIDICDISKRATILTYQKNSELSSVAWSPDGRYIAVNNNVDVQVWEADTTRLLANLRGRISRNSEITWSPDSRFIAVGGPLNMVVFWDVATEKGLYPYASFTEAPTQPANVNVAAWSPGGELIVLNQSSLYSGDQLIVLPAMTPLSTADAGSIPYYNGHNGYVTAAVWSPDSGRIASASYDMTVQVWDAASFLTDTTFTGHSGSVNAVSWSPDGQLVASGGDDMTVQVWKPLS